MPHSIPDFVKGDQGFQTPSKTPAASPINHIPPGSYLNDGDFTAPQGLTLDGADLQVFGNFNCIGCLEGGTEMSTLTVTENILVTESVVGNLGGLDISAGADIDIWEHVVGRFLIK